MRQTKNTPPLCRYVRRVRRAAAARRAAARRGATELADLERALDGGATGAGALRNWSAPLPPVDAAVPAQLLQPVTADGAKRPICACPAEST